MGKESLAHVDSQTKFLSMATRWGPFEWSYSPTIGLRKWVNAVIKPISRLITPISGVMGPYLQLVFGAHFVLLLLGCRFAIIMAILTTPIKTTPTGNNGLLRGCLPSLSLNKASFLVGVVLMGIGP